MGRVTLLLDVRDIFIAVLMLTVCEFCTFEIPCDFIKNILKHDDVSNSHAPRKAHYKYFNGNTIITVHSHSCYAISI